ncbi:class III lanthipeptide [Paenibacillus sp. Z3-2]
MLKILNLQKMAKETKGKTLIAQAYPGTSWLWST